jgi:hypothetical protein
MGHDVDMLLGTYLDSARSGADKQTEIIRSWTDKEMKLTIRNICKAAGQMEIVAPDAAWKSRGSQGRGNLLANLVIENFEETKLFQLKTADGKGFGTGYPDAIGFIEGIGSVLVELKATKSWDPSDSNRRVLLSSVKKCLKMLKKVSGLLPLHLILTAIHDDAGKVINLRCDFMQRDSEVAFRQEISTSHKLLSKASGSSFTLDL